MADIFERNYRCYGYRRMHASLTSQSVNISEKVVRRLMKQECLVAATRGLEYQLAMWDAIAACISLPTPPPFLKNS